jgi:hypothetical protein
MKANVENQIMAQAPSPVQKAYFNNLYQAIAAEVETRAVESDNRKKKAELDRRVLELKEKSIKLRESLQNAEAEDGTVPEVECLNSPCTPVHGTNTFENQSKWLQLLGTGLVVETHHLCTAEKGAEFACMHNRDSTDFMNKDKFLRYILRKTASTEPYEWDLLDERGISVVEHIVEDEDQGPSKEWGEYNWYRHPTVEDVSKASEGKTVWLSPEFRVYVVIVFKLRC